MIETGEFHSLAEARSWALHQEVLVRILERPELIERARGRVATWLSSPEDHPYASEWKALLDGPPAKLQAVLVGKDARACTLRQASPFAGTLDNATRWRILKQPGLRRREAS